jgi:hypothetical protein
MPALDDTLFPGFGQAGERLPHGLQHPEAGYLTSGELQQALIGQLGQVLQRPGRIGFGADRGGGRGVEGAGEHPQAGEQLLLTGGQQGMAPVERRP